MFEVGYETLGTVREVEGSLKNLLGVLNNITTDEDKKKFKIARLLKEFNALATLRGAIPQKSGAYDGDDYRNLVKYLLELRALSYSTVGTVYIFAYTVDKEKRFSAQESAQLGVKLNEANSLLENTINSSKQYEGYVRHYFANLPQDAKSPSNRKYSKLILASHNKLLTTYEESFTDTVNTLYRVFSETGDLELAYKLCIALGLLETTLVKVY